MKSNFVCTHVNTNLKQVTKTTDGYTVYVECCVACGRRVPEAFYFADLRRQL